MSVIERWEVRGAKGSSLCDTETEANEVARDRARLYPDIGPFDVVKRTYVPAEQLQGAVQENERLRQSIEGMARAFDRKGQRIIAQGMRAILADATTDHRAIQAGIEDA